MGLTYWVYTVLKAVMSADRERFNDYKKENEAKIIKLEAKIKELEKSENKWFRKYHMLSNMILKRSCKNKECAVLEAYNSFIEKEGEIV